METMNLEGTEKQLCEDTESPVEEQTICHTSGEWLEQVTGGSGRGGIDARIQTEARHCMDICVWSGQGVKYGAEEMVDRKASH